MGAVVGDEAADDDAHDLDGLIDALSEDDLRRLLLELEDESAEQEPGR